MSVAEQREGVIVYRAGGPLDAIDAYCRRLETALRDRGRPVRYTPDGLHPLLRSAIAPAWVLLQYNPFSWGRWGLAPGLLRDAALLRRRTGAPLGVMVHEAWMTVEDLRSAVMSSWQRLQLRALLGRADLVLTSTEALARLVGGGARHVPIAATVPPITTTPAVARAQLGLGHGLVVGLFGRGHPSRALDHAAAAVSALAHAHTSVTLLNLGADAPVPAAVPGVDVRSPGALAAPDLSRHLWACDLLLLPFTDGVSTRRTTLMAALAHGRPIVGLHGEHTDRVLLDHPEALVLTRAGDPAAFAETAVALAGDRERLAAVGEAGRRLYAERFDWPVAAGTLASALAALTPRPDVGVARA